MENISITLFNPLKKNYIELSKIYESRTIKVFNLFEFCSNKKNDIEKLINTLEPEDYFRINIHKKKYPTTLINFAIGNSSPKLIEKLKTIKLDNNLRIKSLYTQLIYSIITNNKAGINRIKYEIEEGGKGHTFDITITDADNEDPNMLEIALMYDVKPSILRLILSFPKLTPYDKDRLFRLALDLPDDEFKGQKLLYLIESEKCNKYFLDNYFITKNKSSCMKGKIYEQIEDNMLINGISEYFEYCEDPIGMSKKWSKIIEGELEKYKIFKPMIDKVFVNMVLNPILAIKDFTDYIKGLEEEEEDEGQKEDEGETWSYALSTCSDTESWSSGEEEEEEEEEREALLYDTDSFNLFNYCIYSFKKN